MKHIKLFEQFEDDYDLEDIFGKEPPFGEDIDQTINLRKLLEERAQSL